MSFKVVSCLLICCCLEDCPLGSPLILGDQGDSLPLAQTRQSCRQLEVRPHEEQVGAQAGEGGQQGGGGGGQVSQERREGGGRQGGETKVTAVILALGRDSKMFNK